MADSEALLTSLINKNTNQIFQALNQFEFTTENSFMIITRSKKASEIPDGLMKSDSPGISYLRDKYKKHGIQNLNSQLGEEINTVITNVFRENLIDLITETTGEGVKIHVLSRKSWTPSTDQISELQKLLNPHSVSYLGDFPPYHFIKLNLTI